jgi:molybdopterin-containing oxidoreductase family membrane subunit
MRKIIHFLGQFIRRLFQGPPIYYAWLVFLLGLIGVGIWGYEAQFMKGLAITGMTDQVSWGFYIGNFTFLGVYL